MKKKTNDKLNENPYENIVEGIITATKNASLKERNAAFYKEFYPKPYSKMDNFGLKLELGLKTKASLVDSSTKDKLAFEDFAKQLDEHKIRPVLERNERGNLEINYDVYTYDAVVQKVGLTRVEGAEVPHQTKVYKKVDVKAEFEKLLEREKSEQKQVKGEQKSDTVLSEAEQESRKNELKQLLQENLKRGEAIEIKVKDGAIHFEAKNDKQLTEILNEIPNKAALSITEKTNRLLENKGDKVSVHQINEHFQEEIERAYPNKHIDENKRNLKL